MTAIGLSPSTKRLLGRLAFWLLTGVCLTVFASASFLFVFVRFGNSEQGGVWLYFYSRADGTPVRHPGCFGDDVYPERSVIAQVVCRRGIIEVQFPSHAVLPVVHSGASPTRRVDIFSSSDKDILDVLFDYPPKTDVARYLPLDISTVHRSIIVADWLVALIGGAPLALMFLSRYRRRTKTTAGLCPNCCYDLRASPDRCPECGRIHQQTHP